MEQQQSTNKIAEVLQPVYRSAVMTKSKNTDHLVFIQHGSAMYPFSSFSHNQ